MELKKENLLIVDDNFDMLEVLHRNLKAMNFHAFKASTVTEALNILLYTPIDLIITDLQMPGGSGLELLDYVHKNNPGLPSLIITGFPSIESAMQASRLGAQDYLTKPFTNQELKKAVSNILARQHKSPKEKVSKVSKVNSYAGMVGNSKAFENLIDMIERVKNNRATVLITGESGTGKELVARAIHYSGAFAADPFVAVNCAAIPESLIESELFGYVKGAFSGADQTRKGLFESANGGTIFLDEIGTMPHNVQSRLLRVLQEKEIRKIGAQNSDKINLRIIAATNENLPMLITQQKFREDLYYRLNVVALQTVPLRHRKVDIPLLVNAFLKKYGKEYGKPHIAIGEEALELLVSYSWPGNVRELENAVQRMIIMGNDAIGVNEVNFLQDNIRHDSIENDLLPLQDVEREYILKVLAAVGNNKTKAAKILQINRKTLAAKLGQKL